VSKKGARWIIITLIAAVAAIMLGLCLFCCRGASFNFRFGFPEQKKGGELVRGGVRAALENPPQNH